MKRATLLHLSQLFLPVPAGSRREADTDEGACADIEIGVLEREVMQGGFMATCFFGLHYSNGSGAQQSGGVPGPGESAYRCGGSGEEAPWDLPGY